MEKRRLGLVIAFSLVFCLIAFGQNAPRPNGQITFNIAEAVDNTPLNNVFVYVRNPYGFDANGKRVSVAQEDVNVHLDNRGLAEISVRPGLYDVFVSRGGFNPKCRVIEVLPGQTTQVIERMTLDMEHAIIN